MAALIGLFAGAWIGYLLWQDWGAAVCGIAGFFAGVKLAAWRAKAARDGSPVAAGGSVPGTRRQAAPPPISGEAALKLRVEELERRVAMLERAAAGDAAPTGYALPPEPVPAPAPEAATEASPSGPAPIAESGAVLSPAPASLRPAATELRATPARARTRCGRGSRRATC